MTKFFRKILRKTKLFILFWMRIVFVRNNFKVPFFIKLKMNFFGGYLADQYVLYDFKHNYKKDYLSEYDWYKSRYINAPFDFAFNNKVICQEILKYHVRMPENYFIRNKNVFYDFYNGVVTFEDIYSKLVDNEKLVIKPFALGKGEGVHVISYIDNNIFIDSTKCNKQKLQQFIEGRDGYAISEFVNQHEYANNLYPFTVNTIRIVMFRDIETHEFKIYFAVQRIGREKTIPVDNASKGGLVSKINLETGILSEGRCLHDLNRYQYHPDTGYQIEGVQIPRWNQIKSEILSITKKLPYMDFIAWDLLLTQEGLCVIEGNASSGVNILQLWGGQRNTELGAFYKYNC